MFSTESTAGVISTGDRRFAFGENWLRFIAVLDDDRIMEAEKSLCTMLRVQSLKDKSFLDVGCGSGLFSLAARRLGAEVISFDRDAQCVACAGELRRWFAASGDPAWRIQDGDVLDAAFLKSLGVWDIVYAWGVLHHTGDLWAAMEKTACLVKPGGSLFISIYNDQGTWSQCWLMLKKLYVSSLFGRFLATFLGTAWFVFGGLKSDLIHLRNPLASYLNYRKRRGMSIWHDWIDWFGGYPFEVAKPGAVVDFFVERGFVLTSLRTVGNSLGTNEFVFRRDQ